MFTGLIEHQARILANNEQNLTSRRLIVESPWDDLQQGESIAVNGVCLTLVANAEGHLAFDVSLETLKLTTFAAIKVGNNVNLERAMNTLSRFGGHYVTGHIDTTAFVKAIKPIGDCQEIMLGDFGRCADLYLFLKGSITLEGVSLTINEVNRDAVKIMLVPHTLANTTLGRLHLGQPLNVEFDYLARVVAHQLQATGYLKNEVKK